MVSIKNHKPLSSMPQSGGGGQTMTIKIVDLKTVFIIILKLFSAFHAFSDKRQRIECIILRCFTMPMLLILQYQKKKGCNYFSGFTTVVAILVHELQRFIYSNSLPATSCWIPATSRWIPATPKKPLYRSSTLLNIKTSTAVYQ